ncbi:hypothetical protein Zmor_025964 [Zophobas morio]|uniref:Uncharacterized protein n=1 Tax=Zophobas morio TaxID=2755281 RepID=A0AA38HSQ4_9CUCU|nr:hypothetical protein Zmor_025964 [Zophobas morio]
MLAQSRSVRLRPTRSNHSKLADELHRLKPHLNSKAIGEMKCCVHLDPQTDDRSLNLASIAFIYILCLKTFFVGLVTAPCLAQVNSMLAPPHS